MTSHVFHGSRAVSLLHRNVWAKTALYNLHRTNTLVYTTASRGLSSSEKSLLKHHSNAQLIPALNLNPKTQFGSILFGQRAFSTDMKRFSTKAADAEKPPAGQEEAKADGGGGEKKEPPKKQSKFKQLYSQYGPIFIVVHLTTVVLWIYSFFLISKQGYDITQLLNVFHTINLMSKETLDSIHYKIDNYKPSSGWVTGENIKHFATAYMVYKVIAPFRYVVSIAICRSLVNFLRAKGLLKR